jgi:hypothetical protein
MSHFNAKDFHFVLNSKLKTEIKRISTLLKFSLSRTVIFILENIDVLTTKMHFKIKDEKNRVENVGWDCHAHIYFPKSKQVFYNKLKSIHKDNNTYSIACKLRNLMYVFIRGVEIYGLEDFLDVLKNAEKRWNDKIKGKLLCIKRNKVRQLPIHSYININYSLDYKPILIKFRI